MKRQFRATVLWHVLACLALVASAISGYERPPTAEKIEIAAMPAGSLQGAGVQSSESVPAAGQSEASEGPPAAAPKHRFIDHTRGGCPPRLLAKGTHIFGEPVLHAWSDMSVDPRKKLYALITLSGKGGTFLEKDGDYVYLNSGAELLGINEVIGGLRFTRQDFNDPDKVDDLLSETAGLHGRMPHFPGSSIMLRTTRGHDTEWLRSTDKNPAALRELRELCKDPPFTFDGDFWSVTVNMFKADGSVDRWRVVGEHDPQANKNQILNIEIIPLKPAGTFSWP